MRRLLALLLLAPALVLVTTPAHAAGCRYAGDGVTVVVHFPRGEIISRCAEGDPGSGLAALQRAGFDVKLAGGNGGGAICRIDGTPASQTCMSMPPADAYWSYWDGTSGDWRYQTVGAGSADPEPGDVEGWRFGSGEKPGAAPPVAPESPAPSPEPEPEPTQAPPSPSETPSATPTESPTASASATPSATKEPKPTPEAGPGTAIAEEPEPSSTGAVEDREDVEPAASSGSSYGWAWGVGLLVLLAGAVAVVAARRRR